MKIGRNEICPLCKSGKKYKKCCGDPRLENNNAIPRETLYLSSKKLEAINYIKKQQQGLGKPIMQGNADGKQFIQVGDTVYNSSEWKTFIDFLCDYIRKVLGGDWGDSELLKKKEDRHIIIQWYEKFCLHQNKYLSGYEVQPMPTNGVVHCYLGLAYNLYLLDHNVELQKLFVRRLKDINNFQGAYYELIVANCLIRAGFELELEDEQDESKKHCEFSATSIRTGKKYWVEAKSRSVAGVLGKTNDNGTTSKDPTNRLSPHLKNALKKPANDERLIFIDLNTPCDGERAPDWFDRAEMKLSMKNADLQRGLSAYIFVTNFPFHYDLNSKRQTIAAFPYGLGISDFAKPEPLPFSEIYRQKQKHIDAHNIIDSFKSYLDIPQTFDGSLPSDCFSGEPQKIVIGERYYFEKEGHFVTVTYATVDEANKRIMIGTDNGFVLTKPMTDIELEDYKKHPDAYFGVIHRQGRKLENEYEFFENMVDIHMSYSKETTLKKMEKRQDYERLKLLDKEELVVLYCEGLMGYILNQQKVSNQKY